MSSFFFIFYNIYIFFQVCILLLAVVGFSSCEEKDKKQAKRGLLGLEGYGIGASHGGLGLAGN